MILDIETTGLSPQYAQVILVGMIYYEAPHWKITQLFCDHHNEEAELLLKLSQMISKEHLLITYNGHSFDLPFLNKRYGHHHIDFQINTAKHFDLYRVIRASKKALQLPNYKLKTIEEYLGIYRNDQISGKESVDLYRQYEQLPTDALRDKILLHNYDDIKFMLPTMAILNHIPESITDKYYPFIHHTHGDEWVLRTMELTGEYLTLELEAMEDMGAIGDYREGFVFQMDQHDILLKIPVFHIEDRTFVDIDQLPFIEFTFNELDLNTQLSFEITDRPSTFKHIMEMMKAHYDL